MEYVQHTITAEDLTNNPDLVNAGINVGDVVDIPVGATVTLQVIEDTKAERQEAERLAKEEEERIAGEAAKLREEQEKQEAARKAAEEEAERAKAEAERQEAERLQRETLAKNNAPNGEVPPQIPGKILAQRGGQFTYFNQVTWDLMGKNKAGWHTVTPTPPEVANK